MFDIISLEIDCLNISKDNVYDFLNILKELRKCKVKLTGSRANYPFTLEQLKFMIQNGIQIVEIESLFLRTKGDDDSLLKFAEVMRKMKHLEKFQFDCDDFEEENAPPMELLTDLPFKQLKSYQFKIFGKENVSQMAKTVALIKSLHWNPNQCSSRCFHIKQNFLSDYLLTPEDFELLKNLPVTSVNLHALDLTKDNVKDFRDIMKQMKIIQIEYDRQELESAGFRINVENWGFGGIYKTIR